MFDLIAVSSFFFFNKLKDCVLSLEKMIQLLIDASYHYSIILRNHLILVTKAWRFLLQKKTHKNLYYWNISKFSGVAQLRIMVPKGRGGEGSKALRAIYEVWSNATSKISTPALTSDSILRLKFIGHGCKTEQKSPTWNQAQVI